MRIFLVGFPTSGKSFYGRKIAKEFNLEFIDLDEFIQKNEGRTITNIFDENDENYFREVERTALEELLKREDIIVATGGGTACFKDNIDKMNEYGKTVYLKVDNETLKRRLQKSRSARPLVSNKSDKEIEEYVEKTLKEREVFYNKAKFIINASTVGVENIILLLKYDD